MTTERGPTDADGSAAATPGWVAVNRHMHLVQQRFGKRTTRLRDALTQ
jgi:hypothetical protein